MALLTEAVKKWTTPAVTIVATRDRDPFKVLVSCILSLRTKDQVTAEASERLFRLGDNPEAISRLTTAQIEDLIMYIKTFKAAAK